MGTAPFVPTGAEYVQNSGGVLKESFNGKSGHGAINVGGVAALDAMLDRSLPDSFNPAVGTTYTFLNSTGLSGTSGTFNSLTFDSGFKTFNPEHARQRRVSSGGDDYCHTGTVAAAPAWD